MGRKARANWERRSPCPVASALDLVGDKWTLLVLRTMFAGRRRFAELLDIPEAISTSILTDRLDWLLAHGMIERRRYNSRPVRYEYTLARKGAELLPVLQALAEWSGKHVEGCWPRPDWFIKGRPEDFVAG